MTGAAVGAILSCLLNAPLIQAQPATNPSLPPAFEVASIKSDEEVKAGRNARVSPIGIEFTRFPLRMLIAEAYDVTRSAILSPDPRVMELLDGGTYDISAKADHEVPKGELMRMLRTLLADRFKLTLHHELRVEPVYELKVAPNGPKLRESTGEGEPEFGLAPNGGAVCRNMTMLEFSRNLAARMGRAVLDQTGLVARYDFILELDRTPGANQLRAAISSGADPGEAKRSMAAAMNDWSSSSIFSDIQKQLGLKLEADKAPVNRLVIDHVEKPSGN